MAEQVKIDNFVESLTFRPSLPFCDFTSALLQKAGLVDLAGIWTEDLPDSQFQCKKPCRLYLRLSYGPSYRERRETEHPTEPIRNALNGTDSKRVQTAESIPFSRLWHSIPSDAYGSVHSQHTDGVRNAPPSAPAPSPGLP